MSAPSVATVIPCYRESSARVLATIESAHLVQQMEAVVLVLDGTWDGSDDLATAVQQQGMADVVRRPSNGGCAAALNDGIRQLVDALGDVVVCRLDVGDAFYPEPKDRQIATVLAGAAASASPWFDPVAGVDRFPPASWAQRIYSDGVFAASTTVFRGDVWTQVGGFDEMLRWGDDWDFAIKVQHAVGHHMHGEVTCSAGQFPGGVSDTGGDPARTAARKAACEVVRRRAQRLRGRRTPYFDKRLKRWT